MRTYRLLDSSGALICEGRNEACERALWVQLAEFYTAAGYTLPKRVGPFRAKIVAPRGGRTDGNGFMREIAFRMVRDDGRECRIRHCVAPYRAVSSDEVRAESAARGAAWQAKVDAERASYAAR